MMKRFFALAVLVGTAMLSVSATAQTYAPGYISGVTVTGSDAGYAPNRSPAQVTDNSGMSDATGPITGLKTATAGNGTTTMWLTLSTSPVTGNWIQFDLGAVHPLDEMWIWNGNQSGQNARQWKLVNIKYKVNATDAWVTLGQFTLGQMGGGTAEPASNQAGTKAPISFGKVNARYVRMESAGDKGVGSYNSADNYVNLSEVRFYEAAPAPSVSANSLNFGNIEVGKEKQLKLVLGNSGSAGSVTLNGITYANPDSKISFVTPPVPSATWNAGQYTTYTLAFRPTAVALDISTMTLSFTAGSVTIPVTVVASGNGVVLADNFVDGVTATANSYNDANRVPANVVNGSGMTNDNPYGNTSAVHGNTTVGTMWVSHNNPLPQEWIQFDLGRTCYLNEMWIWNYNNVNFSAQGMKSVYITTKVNATDAWTTMSAGTGNVFTFARATGTTGRTATNLDGTSQPVTFNGLKARYVRITPTGGPNVGNWGNADPNGTGNGYVGLSEVRFFELKPQATLSATSLLFPGVDVIHSAPPVTMPVDINSTGQAPLTVSGLTIGGTNAAEFSLVSPPSLPLVIQPGQKQTLTLKFAPHQTVITMGLKGTLTVATDELAQPTRVVELNADAVPVGMSKFSAN